MLLPDNACRPISLPETIVRPNSWRSAIAWSMPLTIGRLDSDVGTVDDDDKDDEDDDVDVVGAKTPVKAVVVEGVVVRISTSPLTRDRLESSPLAG